MLATARLASRIVPPQQGRGPVSLSRFDIDVVVTEYGAFALIEIAGPLHRPALAAAWAEYAKLL